jgi:hypothetical protein
MLEKLTSKSDGKEPVVENPSRRSSQHDAQASILSYTYTFADFIITNIASDYAGCA